MAQFDLGQDVFRDYTELSTRGVWESYWEDIAEVVWPNMRRTFRAGTIKTNGDRLNELQVDSTPTLALNRFRAILSSLLTPETSKWHYLRPSDPDLAKIRVVQEWFEQVNDALFRYRLDPIANFANQNGLVFAGVGAFGTGTLFIDESAGQPGLRYKAVHVGETFLRENHQGRVDTVIRRFSLTARQAVQRKDWEGALPDTIVKAAELRPDEVYWFLHRVRPNPDYDPEMLGGRGFPYESTYVSETEKKVVQTGGFTSMPYAVARYEIAPGEVYGRSPAMQALPAIKTLMAQKRTVLTQGHRAVAPVLLAADDGILNNVNLRPGSVIPGAVSPDGRPLLQPLPFGEVNLGRDMMEDERSIINSTFLVDLFQILVETSDRMTATEVLERAQEKGQLLAPTLSGMHGYLGDIVNREIDVLRRQGLIPPMPRELEEAQGDYTIQWDNAVTRSQRAGEAAGLFRVLESILPVINVTGDPSPLDNYDFDIATREIGEAVNIPVRWMRALDEVAQIREGRQQAAQQQQAAAAAPGQAALIKAAADAKSKGLRAEDLQ